MATPSVLCELNKTYYKPYIVSAHSELSKLNYIFTEDGKHFVSQLSRQREPVPTTPKRLREKEFTTSVSKRSRPIRTDDVKTPDSK